MNQDNQTIEYEKEFIEEWERTKRLLPEVFKEGWTGEQNVKDLCYGFYLFGRRTSSEAFIMQMKKDGNIQLYGKS